MITVISNRKTCCISKLHD